MTEEVSTQTEAPARPEPGFYVAPAPHLAGRGGSSSTRWMMVDVLVALVPVLVAALWVFQWYAVKQVAICVIACLVAESLCMRWRGRCGSVRDLSAVVTGAILALSLPWSAPWYVGAIAGIVAVGLGKVVFGGLGQNLFNPAMVGRAFALVCFPAALGASAYQADGTVLDVVSRATPLTLAKQMGEGSPLWPLFIGNLNGSLGETSALACLLGGLYLCLRRTASWEIPAAIVVTVAVLGGAAHAGGLSVWGAAEHLFGGALLLGAFYIATDPVTSPVTKRGKCLFGMGIGAVVVLIRLFSGYPEGVMFAVLLMNAVTPLINRWTVPRPVGGPVPVRA